MSNALTVIKLILINYSIHLLCVELIMFPIPSTCYCSDHNSLNPQRAETIHWVKAGSQLAWRLTEHTHTQANISDYTTAWTVCQQLTHFSPHSFENLVIFFSHPLKCIFLLQGKRLVGHVGHLHFLVVMNKLALPCIFMENNFLRTNWTTRKYWILISGLGSFPYSHCWIGWLFSKHTAQEKTKEVLK